MSPPASEAHYRRQAQLAALASTAAVTAGESGDTDGLAYTVAALQFTAASDADGYVDTFDSDAAGRVQPLAFAGIAGDGRSLLTLFELAESVGALQTMAATAVQDAGRGAVSAAMTARPALTGYVRMLVPPSCARCAVLAGRWRKWNAGYERHPQCDCSQIPAAEDVAGDLTTDPLAAIKAGQVTGLSKADLRAINDGADVSQVINAKSGMSTAQVYGQNVKVTTTGTTVRGTAGKRLAEQGTRQLPGSRYRTATTPRLMPETIYKIAGDDRAEAIRLLERFGYITAT